MESLSSIKGSLDVHQTNSASYVNQGSKKKVFIIRTEKIKGRANQVRCSAVYEQFTKQRKYS